jgi:hypothetical protein
LLSASIPFGNPFGNQAHCLVEAKCCAEFVLVLCASRQEEYAAGGFAPSREQWQRLWNMTELRLRVRALPAAV